MCGRWYSCDTHLGGVLHDHSLPCQYRLDSECRSRGACRHQGGAITGPAGDAMDARGFDGFGEGHGRQDGGEPPRQQRLPRPRWRDGQNHCNRNGFT
jgi:hypothetical protein